MCKYVNYVATAWMGSCSNCCSKWQCFSAWNSELGLEGSRQAPTGLRNARCCLVLSGSARRSRIQTVFPYKDWQIWQCWSCWQIWPISVYNLESWAYSCFYFTAQLLAVVFMARSAVWSASANTHRIPEPSLICEGKLVVLREGTLMLVRVILLVDDIRSRCC